MTDHTAPGAPTAADLDALSLAWRAALDVELDGAVRLRHALHADPRVSGMEDATADAVIAAMGEAVPPADVVAGTGRVLRLGPSGPAVGLRAELDALPLVEATGAAFASANGAMHACGHDVHMAALTAVTRAAARLVLPVGLAVVLQPREEVGPTGATDIVAEGVLAAHDIAVMVGAHVQPQVPAGHVSADAGPVNAAVDEIEIVVRGRGGHGAYPHLTVDPVPALCRTVLALQDVARSEVDPLHPVVVSVTQLAGAGAPNVIGDVATAAGTVRTMRTQDAERLHAGIARLVAGIASAHGCVGEYRIRRGEPALVNDARIAAAAARHLAAMEVPTAPFASCGSDDFATYGLQVPLLMLFVGTGAQDGGPMLHDARFLPGDHVVRETSLALLAGWLAAAEVVLGGGATGA